MKIPQNIKAVIFDADGLLIDSEPSWNKSYSVFLKKNGLYYDEEFSANRRGVGLKHFIEELRDKYSLKESSEKLLRDYREIFYEIFFQDVRLLKGAEELVKSLHQNNFQTAIATGGHTKEDMIKILEKFGLIDYFPLIVSSDEVHKGKPDPEVFLLAAKKLQVEPKDCLVLEDSVNGIIAGRSAGMIVFGVIKDDDYRKELKKAGADKVFNYLSEITV